ncbi:XdhC family protein [Dokdonella sp. MW10]|uniref:XdhC family protein n=1 Tax=Dokdonella sp. MW10 TaxID=2992926 RepID=UPI003F7F2695
MTPADTPSPAAAREPTGSTRAVFEAALGAGSGATLAIVVETEGSTYVRPGALALFGAEGLQSGWLSGGCIEPEIAVRAVEAAAAKRLEWMDVDTRDDEDLFAGSAVGCRGRLHLALLPLDAMPGWQAAARTWLARTDELVIEIAADGAIAWRVGGTSLQWQLVAGTRDDVTQVAGWSLHIAPPPSVLVLGAGPETPTLLPLMRRMGWLTTLVERRPRWIDASALADHAIAEAPATALRGLDAGRHDAVLVMHHNFELDREALEALADAPIAYVGLLGPNRRREDLFSVLAAGTREALGTRLHSPVGLPLGGHGPEAISLSIVAQVQAWLHASTQDTAATPL